MKRGGAAAVVALWAVTTLLWLQPGILIPDGAGYVSYLPSTWLGHDLLFFDEWARFGLIRDDVIRFKDATATDHLGNHWTAGSALVWYPAYVLGDWLQRATHFQRNGISLPYNVPVVATSAAAGLLTLLLGYAIARRRFGDWSAGLAAAGIWLASPLMWYSLRHATMCHAVSAAACAGIVMLSLRLRDGVTHERMFSAGMAVGLAAAIRPQSAPFVLVPLLVLGLREWRAFAMKLPAFVGGGLLASLPQLIVSMVLYGAPLAFVNVGGAQTSNNWHPFERVWLIETMFSSYHGMFYWTPLLAVSVAGFWFLRRADRGLGDAALAMFAIQWLMNSILDRTFWSGASFGQRRFDNCTIFFLLGLAAIAARLPRWAGALVVALGTAWSLSLFFAAGVVDLNVYQTPAQLWGGQLAALRVPHVGFLLFVPSAMKMTVLLFALAAFALLATLAFAMTKATPTTRAAIAAAYLGAMSLFFIVCSRNDAARIAPWRAVIAANRAHPTGGLFNEIYALQNEYDYLRRSGREAEAARVLADYERLRRRNR